MFVALVSRRSRYYGEQSYMAGRAAFLTGRHGLRTGLTKVGFSNAPMGMSQLDPSIGGLLKSLGCSTAQFGKNHVDDRNPSLPTVNIEPRTTYDEHSDFQRNALRIRSLTA